MDGKEMRLLMRDKHKLNMVKTTNKTKILTISQQELEWCRRNVLREFILISANLGTRPVSELLNVKRKDVNITKTKFKDWYADGNDEWRLTCDLFIDSRKTGERMVNGIAGRFFYSFNGVLRKSRNYVRTR